MHENVEKDQVQDHNFSNLGGSLESQTGGSDTPFVDNRPGTMQLQKMQEAVNDSPRVRGEMPMFSDTQSAAPMQRQVEESEQDSEGGESYTLQFIFAGSGDNQWDPDDAAREKGDQVSSTV